jgi:hypothetical protein
MGNWNPKYFEKKSGSLEEAILNAVNGVKTQINEKKMDAVGKEDGDIDNDGDKDSSDKYLAKRRKAIGKAMKSEADDFKPHMMYDPKTGKGYEAKTMDDHLRMKKMGYDHEKPKMEAYEIGTKEYANHTKKTTPGQFESQGEKNWNETVSNIHKKQTSMREALAKVWGIDEGKSPFENDDKKMKEKKEKNGKTMTGKPMTKVDVDPDMKEKKN